MGEKVEILAPAGSWDSLVAGVRNGADAVYLGGTVFNARQYAANFGNRELKKAVDYCHFHGVKVYVTVNILILQKEFHEIVDYIYFLYSIGADAVIVQDVGLLYFLRTVLPDLPVHASTQMTIHNLFGADYLWDLGIKRVVLARELTIEEIKYIADHTNIELEIFAHGALCISYSGQCLFSSMIGGRSGNRGRCAQPCRLPYHLVEINRGQVKRELATRGEYILSTRDLNTIHILPEIIQTGITSLKFEGRMKRPEYVATVIRIYRDAIERYYLDPFNYFIKEEEMTALIQIFNREFTDAHLTGEHNFKLIGYSRPNNRGLFLGRVMKINGKIAQVKLEEDLHLGDGIEVWVTIGGRKGLIIKEIGHRGKTVQWAEKGSTVQIEVPDGVRKGDRIFKTYDQDLMSKASSSYALSYELPKIPLSINVKGELGRPLLLHVVDADGNKIEVASEINCQKALKHSVKEDMLYTQLGRLGNTRYELNTLKVDMQEDLMVPISEINRLRRKMVDALDKKRGQHDNDKVKKTSEKDYYDRANLFLSEIIRKDHNKTMQIDQPHHLQLNVKVGDFSSFVTASKIKVNCIYVPVLPYKNKTFSMKQLKEAMIVGKGKDIKVIPYLPRILHDSAVNSVLNILDRLNCDYNGIMVGNLGSIRLVKKYFSGAFIHGDYFLNIMNASATGFFLEQGLVKLCLSPELSFSDLEEFTPEILIVAECLVHGYIPLLVSRYCPVAGANGECNKDGKQRRLCSIQGALKDRKNYLFPFEMDGQCLMHLFNSKALCLIDSLERFKALNINSIRLDLEREDEKTVQKVCELYAAALYEGEKDQYRAEIERLYPEGITRGHYFRGVE
ncbi:MAG: DUF3656 domain-containing protein [Bacillota bacterium]